MPNYCNYTCRITGPKKGIDRFIQAAKTKYNEEHSDTPEHFWRVFQFDVDMYEELSTDIYQATAWGYCAWSVHACFTEEGYQRTWKDDPNHGITIEQIAEEENLVIEFYSDECGMCFAEHIICTSNGILTDDTVDYTECTYDMEWEECNERSGLDWSKQQWDEYFKHNDTYRCCEFTEEFTDHIKLLEANKND